jgi:anaerobic magnesium-protoporphyrin IX monomethyl ester cyclase
LTAARPQLALAVGAGALCGMLSILVCHSYFLRFDPKQQERAKPYPPLATLQVAAMLRRAGHEVQVFDAMLATGIGEYEAQLRRVRPQLVLLYEDNYNFLSKMCLARMRSAAREMIVAARRGGACVIAAGSDASDAPAAYLSAGAAAVLIGEGLVALTVLLERLDAAPSADVDTLARGVPGVASAAGNTPEGVEGQRAPAVAPQPELAAWDLIDIERYRSVWRAAHGYFSLNMAASRGCPFRCTWCAKPIWGNQYLQRSPETVAAEMAHLKREFAPDHIWFADDIFGFRVDWVRRFGDALQACGGGVPFTIQMRADLLSSSMAAALAHAGCREAWLGAESGSQRILDAMNKGTSVAEILTARERLKTQGIRVGFFIQLGYVGEELEDILATRKLIDCARPDDVGVSVAYPLPGTKFYELVRAQLGAKTHWLASDDLAMMFHGTYQSAFYREVRDLLHEQVRIGQTRGHDRVARAALQRRWRRLLAREAQFRHEQNDSAAPAHAETSRAAACDPLCRPVAASDGRL